MAEIRLETVEKLNVERRLRKIVAAPLMGSFSAEKEEVKKRCRELILKWGNIRREQRLRTDDPNSGNTFAQLMKRAEEMLQNKRNQKKDRE